MWSRSRRRIASTAPSRPTIPAKFVQMLLDWKGEVTGSFGIDSVEETAVGVVIDGDGRILAHGAGPDAGDTLVAAIPAK